MQGAGMSSCSTSEKPAAAGCGCGSPVAFDGASPAYKRALRAVIALNVLGFAVVAVGSWLAASASLAANTLDFAADAATYGVSLWAIGKAVQTRSIVALAKGVSLAVMAVVVLGLSILQTFALTTPESTTMSTVGLAALAANVISALILMKYRDGDANVRSVWLCTRNDAVGNVAVVLAGVAVAWTASAWPDLLVAIGMAALFLSSSVSILRQALSELRSSRPEPKVHAHAD